MTVTVVAFALGMAALAAIPPARAGTIPACGWVMASKSKDDKASRATYDWPASDGTVSANGRYIVFSTDAHNLTANDDDSWSDVFLRDLETGTIKLVGRGVNGRDPNEDSWGGMVTNDGKYLLFSSGGTNVHPAANGFQQLYRRNLRNGDVELVSRSVTGAPANMSTEVGSITQDGRYVVFISQATNMLGAGGSRTESVHHTYVRDIKRRRTIPVSITPAGRFRPGVGTTISADGRFVAFVHGEMGAAAEVYLRDLELGRTKRISRTYDGSINGERKWSSNASITPSGRYVMYTSRSNKIVRNDTNGAADVFVYDRRTKRTRRASVGNDGKQANRASLGMSISNDGSVVTFTTRSTNLDARVRDFHVWRRDNAYAHDLSSGRTRLFTICDDGTENTGAHNPDPIRISGNKKTILLAVASSNFAPESSQGPQFRYQVYHRRFSILPPTVLTTTGPYTTSPGTPIDLGARTRTRTGDPIGGRTVTFVVARANGTVLWRGSATTDGTGSASVTYAPGLSEGTFTVTAITPATATQARATMDDRLRVVA